MSRIGKKPIVLPAGVQVKINGRDIEVSGPKGKLSWRLPTGIEAREKEGMIILSTSSDSAGSSSLWGTNRAVLANMVAGVEKGYAKRLNIEGVGYRAQVQGDKLVLLLGFSHPVEITAPEGISFSVEKNTITVSGIDKVLVGETAAKIRAKRKPEPYKGKGIRYENEIVRRKAGKKAVGAA